MTDQCIQIPTTCDFYLQSHRGLKGSELSDVFWLLGCAHQHCFLVSGQAAETTVSAHVSSNFPFSLQELSFIFCHCYASATGSGWYSDSKAKIYCKSLYLKIYILRVYEMVVSTRSLGYNSVSKMLIQNIHMLKMNLDVSHWVVRVCLIYLCHLV